MTVQTTFSKNMLPLSSNLSLTSLLTFSVGHTKMLGKDVSERNMDAIKETEMHRWIISLSVDIKHG